MSTSNEEHKHTNHLINENSPYLLSHAHNPVDWYPWGEEALNKAKAEDKPIFLSIGYAACHWCHVMERESFENERIAAILNQHFVSIKVDREQRPDLDHIYMTFTMAMTGHGGWPMSVFLTSDLKPFFAGTYFPPDSMPGRSGFGQLLGQIVEVYTNNRDQLNESAETIAASLTERIKAATPQTLLVSNMISDGARANMRNFDQVNGGFGTAPKFPHTTELSLFLRHFDKTGDEDYLRAAEKSLQGMARGGIYDHLGGGFARYSVDAQWLVPHFEKMLYDNALLVPVYGEAFQLTGKAEYLNVIRGTLDFILNEMTDKTGGFYSALDADSEGEEGKFYVWSKKEIDEILGDESRLFCAYYNVTEDGNFEGHNILNLSDASAKVKNEANLDDFDATMAACREKLLDNRAKRVRPLTDDKILTSWNGLALTAFCVGYQLTGEQKYLQAARRNAQFVKSELFHDGSLIHSYRDGKKSSGQFLEDYGYYLPALLDLYQTDPSRDNFTWLEFAISLADHALDLFMDDDGSLYLRPEGESDLLFRPKEENDGARPAPGSYLVHALLRLGRLTGNNEYSLAGEKGLRALSGLISQYPNGMTSALAALDYHLSDKYEIVIVGPGGDRDAMLTELYRRYLPNRLLAISEDGRDKLPLFEGRQANNENEVTAYICRNSVCRLPVSTLDQFRTELDLLKK